jgi:serine/threonine protein kinase
MASQLKISAGQYSDKGRKETNQDFHAIYLPREPLLSSKGITIDIADGISSSDVSQVASQSAVKGFIEDYYSTSEAWSVKTSAERVLTATNSWLHAQTKQSHFRYEMERGYVCTFSAMVIKSTTAHIFHIGDSRIYQLRDSALEQLTHDHRVWTSSEQSHLSRALGAAEQLEIDYRSLQIEKNDVFIFATDGIYEYVSTDFVGNILTSNQSNLDHAAQLIAQEAIEKGSGDNLTLQIVRIEQLPSPEANEIYQQLSELPLPPLLEPRMQFDGYKILREVRSSSRSHIYLAEDAGTNEVVIIKIPSIDLRSEPAYLERFLMEEWIARRINSAHVLKPCQQTRKRSYIYVATEYIDGQTLTQWMIDNPKPSIETVRGIIEQVAKGLQAFHRLEMVHQDLNPGNIMIDKTGTIKIIDFGSTRVAGLMEIATPINQHNMLGSAQYAAPEYFLGESGTSRSDIFSLGVIAYEMLTGKLPYGAEVPKCKTASAQRKLRYLSLLEDDREIPAWIDEAIMKAVHPNPFKRYEEISEFVFDLHHPNKDFLNKRRPPLIEQNPVVFWRMVSLVLSFVIVCLLLSHPLSK